jgi:hypothetical protein
MVPSTPISKRISNSLFSPNTPISFSTNRKSITPKQRPHNSDMSKHKQSFTQALTFDHNTVLNLSTTQEGNPLFFKQINFIRFFNSNAIKFINNTKR